MARKGLRRRIFPLCLMIFLRGHALRQVFLGYICLTALLTQSVYLNPSEVNLLVNSVKRFQYTRTKNHTKAPTFVVKTGLENE